MGDINVDLNSIASSSCTSEYLHVLQINAFSNLLPTRVSKTIPVQTINDHILSDNIESIITRKMLLYKISDHFPIICTIENSKSKAPKPETFVFLDLKTINVLKFRYDLETILIPLVCVKLLATHVMNT